MRKQPDTSVIEAITALNSYVRSEPGQMLGQYRFREAVYNYKRAVLAALYQSGVDLSPLVIWIQATCRDCGGSGQYVDSYGDSYDHCWACSNSGLVRLEFVQTRLPTGKVFHSPRQPGKCPDLLLKAMHDSDPLPAPEDWALNREGKPMEPPDVAGALNAVEAWYGLPTVYQMPFWWRYDITDPWVYKLPLGIRPRVCAFCGGDLADEPMRYLATSELLHWGDWCCPTCAKIYYPQWPPFPIPLDLISEPAGAWLARREHWTQEPPRAPIVYESAPEADRSGYIEETEIPF